MKFHEALSTAFSAILQEKMRSALTMLGIIIGVAAILAMVGIGDGAKVIVTQELRKFGGEFTVRRNPWIWRGDRAVPNRSGEYLKYQDALAIESECPTIEFVIPSISYERFFDWIENGRRGRRVGPPKFKRKGRRSAKFQTGYKVFEERKDGKPSKVPKGTIRLSFKQWDAEKQKFVFLRRNILYHHHRDWKANVRYIQILRDTVGTYWLYVVTDNASKEVLPATGESVGADFGLETYLTLNTGEKIQHPQPLKRSLNQLRTLNKSLSRKVKGSRNWWRAVGELARLYRKVANQRRDWHWKLATDLCRRFDLIAAETLNLEGMKRLWGRKVSDLAFYEFVEILKFKCLKHNREFRQVGQWTATSKPCSDCGHRNENLSLSDRQWICPKCGSHHDRDINAAINILRVCLGPPMEQTSDLLRKADCYEAQVSQSFRFGCLDRYQFRFFAAFGILHRCRSYGAQERLATFFYKYIVAIRLKGFDGSSSRSASVFPAEFRLSSPAAALKLLTHPRRLFNEKVLTPHRFNVESQQGFSVRFSEIKPPISVSATTRGKSAAACVKPDGQTVNGHFNTRMIPQSVACLLDGTHSLLPVMWRFKGEVDFT